MSERTAAERITEADATTHTGQDAPKATLAKKPPRFDPTISSAVRYARQELHSKRPSLKDGAHGAHVGAASGGDHVAVPSPALVRI